MLLWHLRIVCWKEQECAMCGGTVRFRAPRKAVPAHLKDSGPEGYVRSDRATGTYFFAPLRPCPHCGFIQPDMISRRRVRAYGVALFFAVLLGTFLSHQLQYGWGLLPAVVGGMALTPLFFLVHVAILSWRPNRRLEA